jgi:hypothetical protein
MTFKKGYFNVFVHISYKQAILMRAKDTAS